MKLRPKNSDFVLFIHCIFSGDKKISWKMFNLIQLLNQMRGLGKCNEEAGTLIVLMNLCSQLSKLTIFFMLKL